MGHRDWALRALAVSISLAIAACSGGPPTPPATIDGLCRSLTAPEYVIRGATRSDQIWIDENTETLIEGCRWERPKPRPAPKPVRRSKLTS